MKPGPVTKDGYSAWIFGLDFPMTSLHYSIQSIFAIHVAAHLGEQAGRKGRYPRGLPRRHRQCAEESALCFTKARWAAARMHPAMPD